MKILIIKAVIRWLWEHHKYLLEETVIGDGYHRHKNGKRKKVTE